MKNNNENNNININIMTTMNINIKQWQATEKWYGVVMIIMKNNNDNMAKTIMANDNNGKNKQKWRIKQAMLCLFSLSALFYLCNNSKQY